MIVCSYTGNPDYIGGTYHGDSMALKSTINVNYHNSGSNIYKTFIGNVFGDSVTDFAGRVQDGASLNDWSGRDGTYMDESLVGGLELLKMKAITNRANRGDYPGIFFSATDLQALADLTIEEGSGELAGRLVLFKKSSSDASGNYESGAAVCVAYDITGPWR